MPLPEADAATRAYFVGWLERFAGYVRDVDYAAARPLFHPHILAFGTHRDISEGVASCQATQWDTVWPRPSHFRFAIAADVRGPRPHVIPLRRLPRRNALDDVAMR